LKPIRVGYLFYLLTFCAISQIGAQVNQIDRFEIELSEEEDAPYTAVSAKEHGLMVYRRLLGRRQDQLEMMCVDTTLSEKWRGYIDIDKNVSLVKTEVREELFFLLFRNKDYASSDFKIVAVNVRNGQYGTYQVNNLIPFIATDFEITNDAALIGGYFNYRPLILHYSFITQKSKILPGFFNEPGELNQMKINEDGSVDVIVCANDYNKKKSLWIRNYSNTGDLIKTTVLQPEDDKNLIFGRSLKMANGQQVVSGVYGRFKEYSRGIFIASVSETGEYKINYYNYGELQRFFNYMRANRQQRVKGRIERRKIKGKKLRFNYRFLVHELIPHEGQYLMLGEAFYPHYSYPSKYQTSGGLIPQLYSNPLSRGDLVFDGYQYTHAVVIGFDKSGELVWDNSFEISDVRSYTLEQFVKLQTRNDQLILLYVLDNRIRTKVISNSEIVEGKTFDEIKLKFGDDFIKERAVTTSKLDYWYDDRFYAYGIQQVKNLRDMRVNMERKVFFINKITYK
jgi:hypothetical protein